MKHLIAIVAVLIICLPAGVYAQTSLDDFMPFPISGFTNGSKAFGDFQITLAPYLWAVGLEGTIGVRGRTAPVDLSFGEVLDMLQIGFFNFTEIRKGKVAVLSDFLWAQLEDTVELGRFRSVTSDVELLAGDVMLGYRVGDGPITVDLLAGARYFSMSTDIEYKGLILNLQVSGNQSWVDPVIGSRFMFNLTEDVGFQCRFDVGGFNVSSESLWQVIAGFNYRLNDDMIAVLAYRHLSYRYFDNDAGFTYDAGMGGLGIAFAFQF